MGMAASQARYLGLTARKTNCEWEGQQINQARTALSNQSGNLFNQMLALTVPDCPDKTNYTTVQYSYSDGSNNEVLENWKQLSDSNNEYNYVVDHYYYANLYTGSKKLVDDPQVTIKSDTLDDTDNYGDLTTNADGTYTYSHTDATTGKTTTGTYTSLTSYTNEKDFQNAILNMANDGYIKIDDTSKIDLNNMTDSAGNKFALMGYCDNDGTWHFAKDNELKGILNTGYADLTNYKDKITKNATTGAWETTDAATQTALQSALGLTSATDVNNWLATNYKDTNMYYKTDGTEATKGTAYKAFNDYTTSFNPTYVGNQKLTELTNLTTSDEAALEQIVKDLPDSSIAKYFTKNTNGDYTYNGTGVYSYTLNGTTKYTTYDDLVNSMQTSLFANKPIDDQQELATYEASYINTKVSDTDKALIETDGKGRFSTVKFSDDSTTYTLNCEETTDENAYNDAMNSYYHDVSVYEKKIADINAKTEVIQQQDRTLELRLKQLDTEQNALQTEMEAVKKVISKNVEMTFKTFSGS